MASLHLHTRISGQNLIYTPCFFFEFRPTIPDKLTSHPSPISIHYSRKSAANKPAKKASSSQKATPTVNGTKKNSSQEKQPDSKNKSKSKKKIPSSRKPNSISCRVEDDDKKNNISTNPSAARTETAAANDKKKSSQKAATSGGQKRKRVVTEEEEQEEEEEEGEGSEEEEEEGNPGLSSRKAAAANTTNNNKKQKKQQSHPPPPSAPRPPSATGGGGLKRVRSMWKVRPLYVDEKLKLFTEGQDEELFHYDGGEFYAWLKDCEAGKADPTEAGPYPLLVQDHDLRTLLEIKYPGTTTTTAAAGGGGGGGGHGGGVVKKKAVAAAAGPSSNKRSSPDKRKKKKKKGEGEGEEEGDVIKVPTTTLLPESQQPDNMLHKTGISVVRRGGSLTPSVKVKEPLPSTSTAKKGASGKKQTPTSAATATGGKKGSKGKKRLSAAPENDIMPDNDNGDDGVDYNNQHQPATGMGATTAVSVPIIKTTVYAGGALDMMMRAQGGGHGAAATATAGVPAFVQKALQADPPYVRHVQPTPDDLDLALEYDMDEEDEQWLIEFNSNRGRKGKNSGGGGKRASNHNSTAVSPSLEEEWFEHLMDRMEKEYTAVLLKHPEKWIISRPNDTAEDGGGGGGGQSSDQPAHVALPPIKDVFPLQSCLKMSGITNSISNNGGGGGVDEDIVKGVYGYWKAKHERAGRPLIQRLWYEPPWHLRKAAAMLDGRVGGGGGGEDGKKGGVGGSGGGGGGGGFDDGPFRAHDSPDALAGIRKRRMEPGEVRARFEAIRRDLESARTLMDQIRKREKLKRRELGVFAEEWESRITAVREGRIKLHVMKNGRLRHPPPGLLTTVLGGGGDGRRGGMNDDGKGGYDDVDDDDVDDDYYYDIFFAGRGPGKDEWGEEEVVLPAEDRAARLAARREVREAVVAGLPMPPRPRPRPHPPPSTGGMKKKAAAMTTAGGGNNNKNNNNNLGRGRGRSSGGMNDINNNNNNNISRYQYSQYNFTTTPSMNNSNKKKKKTTTTGSGASDSSKQKTAAAATGTRRSQRPPPGTSAARAAEYRQLAAAQALHSNLPSSYHQHHHANGGGGGSQYPASPRSAAPVLVNPDGVRGPKPPPSVVRVPQCVWCGSEADNHNTATTIGGTGGTNNTNTAGGGSTGTLTLLGCSTCHRCYCFKCFQRRPGHGINNWARAVRDASYTCVVCKGLEVDDTSINTGAGTVEEEQGGGGGGGKGGGGARKRVVESGGVGDGGDKKKKMRRKMELEYDDSNDELERGQVVIEIARTPTRKLRTR